MGFLAPLALIGLISVPIIIGFYMLRLRRPERAVSSTFLWQQLVRDVEANAPWQKLRRSLLLLLQVLLAVIFAVLVARPFAEHPAGLARDLVLVIDASASMSSTDDFPTRLEAAKRLAIEQMGEVPSDGRVSVIAATETARVVANEATDRSRITRAIESIEASTGASDLTDALKLAGSLAQRARGAEVLVVTDDAGSVVPDVTLEVPVRVATVGRERNNQAIAALAVRSDSSGLRRTLFVSVANYSAEAVGRRLEILADNTPVTARDLALQPLSRADVVIDELPAGATVVQARITAPSGAGSPVSGAADYLPIDDSAWAVVPPDRLRKVLLVGPGNVYLQNAFSLLPNVELYGATAAEYPATTGKELYDLIVFDGFLPPELPNKPILAFAPPSTSDLGIVSGTLEEFGMGQPNANDPLLRGVDLTRLHIAKTQNLELPEWARPVIPGSPGPLVYAGLRQGLATVVFAFDIRQSDLPLQIAWPILVSNVAGELLGVGPQQNYDPLPPASPVEIPITPDATGVRVTLPDGTVEEIAPGATGASTVSFVNTRQLGIYRVEVIKAPAPSASPGATPAASPTPDPSGSPQPQPPTDDRNMFAVDLFAPDESNIRPGDGARISSLGADLPGEQAAAGMARDEFWPLVAALALAFLIVEWLVYERDGARRIMNALRGANPFAGRTRATGRKSAG